MYSTTYLKLSLACLIDISKIIRLTHFLVCNLILSFGICQTQWIKLLLIYFSGKNLEVTMIPSFYSGSNTSYPITSFVCQWAKCTPECICFFLLLISSELIISDLHDHNSFLTCQFLLIAHLLPFGSTQKPEGYFKHEEKISNFLFCPTSLCMTWFLFYFPLTIFEPHCFLKSGLNNQFVSAFKVWHLLLPLTWTLSSSSLQLLTEEGFFSYHRSQLHIISLVSPFSMRPWSTWLI